MVEFGAGGNIVHAEEVTAEEAPGDSNAGPVEGALTAAQNPPANESTPRTEPVPVLGAMPTFAAAAQAGRRKRRAKGWFCPVCRQRKLISYSNVLEH